MNDRVRSASPKTQPTAAQNRVAYIWDDGSTVRLDLEDSPATPGHAFDAVTNATVFYPEEAGVAMTEPGP